MDTAQDVVEICQRLQIVHDLIGRKFFQSFLDAEFQWSQQSASRFMRAAHVFGGVDCLDNFVPSALYVLSTSRVPAAALPEALELARSGAVIKQSIAHQIVLWCRGEFPELRAITAASAALEAALEQSVPCSASPAAPAIARHVAALVLRLARWQTEPGEISPAKAEPIEAKYPP
jgi:hypothetical protein